MALSVGNWSSVLCTSCGDDAGDNSRFCPACGSALARAVEGAEEYIGKIIAGKYRVEQMIGEGGMGKVYRARQIALDKPVVLKVLRQSLLSDERTVARFQREAKAASRLNHANSISILDFGQSDDGSMFIAMEFVSGRDLHQILSREWPLAESRVIRIISQVLSALADAHSAGVIHRDLKPENIMVEQRRNEPDFVKVLDFGIAKIQDSTGDDGPALTRAGFVCGTPEYMSPEQARGGALDHRSDLYAVGVILYQLMSGVLPFESDSAVGFATKHLNEKPVAPSQKRPDVKISPALDALILRTLSKDPNDRPENAEAFRAELAAVEANPQGTRPRAPVRRPPPGNLSSPHHVRHRTPEDQAQTRVSAEPAWTHTQTQADPLQRSGRPHPPALARSTSGSTDRTGRGGHAESLTSERTEAFVPTTAAPESSGGLLAFKLLTAVLVVVSLSLVGYYLYSVNATPSAPYTLPSNAPLPLNRIVGDSGDVDALYSKEIAADERDPAQARKSTLEGDRAFNGGDLPGAQRHYEAAFALSADPELALKLGQIAWLQNDLRSARGWWARHLRDNPNSRAHAYIQDAVEDLVVNATP